MNNPDNDASTKENTFIHKLIYVIHKHQATHLHYDFRLEFNGILKSWAIPKGPSMNSSDKRLAVMVDDHPLDYASFEGEIPINHYGAGIVEIWDRGTWTPDEKNKEMDIAIKDGLLEFSLNGHQLQGKFILVKMKRSTSKNNWLLIKQEDEYASMNKYDANKIPPLHGITL